MFRGIRAFASSPRAFNYKVERPEPPKPPFNPALSEAIADRSSSPPARTGFPDGSPGFSSKLLILSTAADQRFSELKGLRQNERPTTLVGPPVGHWDQVHAG